MNVNREELKKMVDLIHEEDAAEVYDFIGYLNMKRETMGQIDPTPFSEDKELIHQVQKSLEDRKNGRIYDQKQGLKYLQSKIKAFESEQNL